jgi:hypothetical protein
MILGFSQIDTILSTTASSQAWSGLTLPYTACTPGSCVSLHLSRVTVRTATIRCFRILLPLPTHPQSHSIPVPYPYPYWQSGLTSFYRSTLVLTQPTTLTLALLLISCRLHRLDVCCYFFWDCSCQSMRSSSQARNYILDPIANPSILPITPPNSLLRNAPLLSTNNYNLRLSTPSSLCW